MIKVDNQHQILLYLLIIMISLLNYAFQLVRESEGTDVTPSGWQQGKKTLKPGPELVGNVWKEWSIKEAYDSAAATNE